VNRRNRRFIIRVRPQLPCGRDGADFGVRRGARRDRCW